MTEVFCAGTHAKVPSECSHRQYTAEVGWFHLVLLRASRWLAWQSTFWVPYHRPHNTLQEQQQGEHWPEKIPWQLAVSERGFFWGEGGRVVDATNDRKLKVVGGGGKWLCVTQPSVLISGSSVTILFPFWHHLECAFMCTFDRVKAHADKNSSAKSSDEPFPASLKGALKWPEESSLGTNNSPFPWLPTGNDVKFSSASVCGLVCFSSASVLPCSAFRSDSSWLM